MASPTVIAQPPSALSALQNRFCLFKLSGVVWISDRQDIEDVRTGHRSGEISMFRKGDGQLLMERYLETLPIPSDAKKTISQFMTSPNTKMYDEIAFSPLPTRPDTLNYWVPSPVIPHQGDWLIIRQYLLEVICDLDMVLYRYLMLFLAHMLQKPEEKPGILMAMLAGQGTGKGTFYKFLLAIWQQTTLMVSDVNHVIGQFNAAIERNYVIYMDEALFAGDKKAIDRLKSFLTEPAVTIEQKHQPRRTISSYHRFFAASNHSHFAQVDADDRRFVFFRVSKRRHEDFDYWAQLNEALEDPAIISAAVHDLMNYNLTNYNVRQRPKTPELIRQKLKSLSNFDRYWLEVLQTGEFGSGAYPDPTGTWSGPCFLSTESMMDAWKNYERGQRLYAPQQESEIHEALKRLCPSAEPDRKKIRNLPQKRGFQLPALPVARAEFERSVGGAVEWHDHDVGKV